MLLCPGVTEKKLCFSSRNLETVGTLPGWMTATKPNSGFTYVQTREYHLGVLGQIKAAQGQEECKRKYARELKGMVAHICNNSSKGVEARES